ncbi:DUF4376 domain-containing protein [Xanthobacter sp. KR7-225]|uniref:DUF4376 domain-containing protein n=1 Tax=Xanthobacter sp. KR7-225 TaxID=3156613 RepID=UPI0032B53D9F
MSTTKTVYQCDPDGVYVGEALARESPMEPGVWHLPAGCTEKAPPKLAEGERAMWTGKKWQVLKPAPAPEPAPPTEAELREHARLRRLKAEAAGVMVAGITYATDLESQARMVTALAFLDQSGGPGLTWKSWHGYVVLTEAELRAAAVAVGAHVQACFAAEATVVNAIADGIITTLEAIDVDPGWPDAPVAPEEGDDA